VDTSGVISDPQPPSPAAAAFTPLRREKLSETVAEQLRSEIRRGGLKSGERIPGHRELADAFSVGLSSIREAISMLVSEGLVETRAGRGTFVREPRRPSLVIASDHVLSQREIEEVLEAREVLELQLVGMAAERASGEDVERMRRCLKDMESAVDDASAYAVADLEFHLALADAAHNRFLRQAVEQIRSLVRQNMQVSFDASRRRTGGLQVSLDSHRQLLEAVEAGDAETARARLFAIMSRHHEFVLGSEDPDEAAPPSS
jgi:GntR family transcriptional regulator, transcriptional repressor for pyruvate dehydrogenase complex